MSKQIIVNTLSESLGITKTQAAETYSAFIEAIKEGLNNSENNSLRLSDFGTFSVKDTPERQGRNPQNGEPLTIPAGKRISFKPASSFKNDL